MALPALPVGRDLRLLYLGSLIVAFLMGAVSVAGILCWKSLYPAAQAVNTVGTDTFGLVAVLPVLLASLWLARRGSLAGLLLWPGCLFYVAYIYAFDAICLPPGWLFLPHIALVVLSAYTLIGLLACIDGDALKRRLAGIAPGRSAGLVLAALAALFVALDVVALATAIGDHAAVDPVKQAAWIIDLALECPLLLLGGYWLWRRAAPGFAAGAGLLFQIVALLAGVPFAATAGALLTGSPADASSAMLLLFAVFPLALLVLFLRAAAKAPDRRRNVIVQEVAGQ